MITEELMDLLNKGIKSYKVSIEKTLEGDYLVGVLVNKNYLIYNDSEKIPFKKHQVIDVIHNILKMKYSTDFRFLNLESIDPVYRTIAEYHYDKDLWSCPVEFLWTTKKLTENKLEIKDYKDPEDLFLL